MSGAAHREGPTRARALWLIAAWSVLVAAGLTVLWWYENAPGRSGEPPSRWPESSIVARSTELPTLVMLVHPRCPCSRASMDELAGLMLDVDGRLDAVVLFWTPRGSDEGWAHTDLWESATSIPGVRALRDSGGREAARFGAYTSGQTVLFDTEGRLRFSGGVTGSRGHRGSNAGRDAIAALVSSGAAADESTFVFGCELGREVER